MIELYPNIIGDEGGAWYYVVHLTPRRTIGVMNVVVLMDGSVCHMRETAKGSSPLSQTVQPVAAGDPGPCQGTQGLDGAAIDIDRALFRDGKGASSSGTKGTRWVQAERGRFLLIRRIDGTRVALKLTERTRPSTKSPGLLLGANYVCYVSAQGAQGWKDYRGEVYEPEPDSRVTQSLDHIYVVCDTFRIEWSLGDYICFSEATDSMVSSDWTDIADVQFDDKSLAWISYVPAWRADQNQ